MSLHLAIGMSSKIESVNYIRVDKKGHVAEVVLDRPKELNKMDDDFFESFHEAITQVDADVDVRVILIWAEGPIFTAGLDLFKAGPALTACTDPLLSRTWVPNFRSRFPPPSHISRPFTSILMSDVH